MRLFLALAVFLLPAVPVAAPAQLTIRVTRMPASMPANATVYVAGTFNQWNPGERAYTLHQESDGSYAITLPDSVRGPIEFKFTLGSWDHAEIAANGAVSQTAR